MKRYRRPYRIKNKKSIFGNRFLWFLILTFIFIAGIFYLTCFSSFFQIKEIKISGNEKVFSENIRSLIEEKTVKKFLGSKSIFLINLREINKAVLKEFPQIFKIDLKRKFPDKISVKIEERKPIAIFSQAENNFLIDREGIIFEKISEINFFLLKIQNFTLKRNLNLGEKAIEKEKISHLLEIESKLRENLKISLSEISIISEERLNIKTSEGWEIYFSLKEDLNWQVTELSLVLKERIPPEKRRSIEYIDLRFGKVYIFPETY